MPSTSLAEHAEPGSIEIDHVVLKPMRRPLEDRLQDRPILRHVGDENGDVGLPQLGIACSGCAGCCCRGPRPRGRPMTADDLQRRILSEPILGLGLAEQLIVQSAAGPMPASSCPSWASRKRGAEFGVEARPIRPGQSDSVPARPHSASQFILQAAALGGPARIEVIEANVEALPQPGDGLGVQCVDLREAENVDGTRDRRRRYGAVSSAPSHIAETS